MNIRDSPQWEQLSDKGSPDLEDNGTVHFHLTGKGSQTQNTSIVDKIKNKEAIGVECRDP